MPSVGEGGWLLSGELVWALIEVGEQVVDWSEQRGRRVSLYCWSTDRHTLGGGSATPSRGCLCD